MLAELVRLVLERTPGATRHPFNPILVARAEAHRANALRVGGDLPAAERAFRELRRLLADRPLADHSAAAEINSFEASLLIDQRRFVEAEHLLESAVRGYEEAGHARGSAKTLIQRANLVQTSGRLQEALRLFERASGHLDSNEDRFLYLCTITGRVNALCDLDQAEAAARLLAANRAAYLEDEDRHMAAHIELLQARVDLGLQNLVDAEAGFAAARDQLLALDRTYDAILVNLYLADALFAAGKLPELRELAANLVSLFRSRGVERECVASLQLLANAVTLDAVTSSIVADIRRRMSAGSPLVRTLLEPM